MPRRPSARLERRLFRPKRAKPSISAWPGLLAPVTACLLVAIAVLNQHGQVVASSDGTLIAISLSNQNYAAYLPGSFQRANNLDGLAGNWSQNVGLVYDNGSTPTPNDALVPYATTPTTTPGSTTPSDWRRTPTRSPNTSATSNPGAQLER